MSEKKKETLILIDAPNLAFRMFFALERTNMKNTAGNPTWATYGFFKALFDLLDKTKASAIAAAYDCKEPTFRHKEYEEYKANRPDEMPEELQEQWPHIREGLESFEIPIYELPGYEADDVIGTLAKKASHEGKQVLILTGDRDSFQLVDENIKILVPSKGELKEYDREEVFHYWNIYPEQVIDFKALCGDASDNIPGIKGIGEKTAAKLLNEYQTLDNVYQNIENIKQKSLKEKIISGKKSAYLSKRLATILTDVPVTINLKDTNLTMSHPDNVVRFLKKFEFNSFIKRLPGILTTFNHNGSIDINDIETSDENPQQMKLNMGLEISENKSSENENLKTPDIDYKTITNEDELKETIQILKEKKYICIDLETTSVDTMTTEIVGISIGYFEDEKNKLEECKTIKSFYIPTNHLNGEQLKKDFVLKNLKPILEDNEKVKIAQNAKFEFKILYRNGINLKENIYDTMLASYISNPDEKHGLKDQVGKILGFKMTKIDELIGSGKKQLSMAEVDIDKVAPYACADANYTLELAKYYKKTLNKNLEKVLNEIDNPLVPVLSNMELNGVRIDVDFLKELSKEITKKVRELEDGIFQVAKEPFNINSPQQLGKVLFERLGLKNEGNITKTGQYSTDAATLEKLTLEDETGVVEKILEYRQLSKLLSTYTESLPLQINKSTGNIHCDFNQTITSTGRLSSSNPNLQNIPIRSELGKKIRKAFISSFKNGYLLSADYSQIELRVLAHVTDDPVLVNAFKNGEDIHKRTAMEIYGVSENEVTSEMRSHGKTLNFALIYQQGAFATARQLNISQKEAQDFINKYFESFKEVKPFFENLLHNARENGYVETIYGRRRYFKNLNARNKGLVREDERAACNAPLQGTAADIMKLAMIRVFHEIKKQKLESKLILQVHDEIVLDVHPDEKNEIKNLVISSMELDQPLLVPLVVDTAWGNNWYEC